MTHLAINGVELAYEDVGRGYPLVFSHEFGGDRRSWEPQVGYFSRWYRCVAYNHRGFPPSTVPETADAYSQEQLVEDLRGLLDGLGINLEEPQLFNQGVLEFLHGVEQTA